MRDFSEEFDEVTASSVSTWKQFYQCKYLLTLGWKKVPLIPRQIRSII